MKEKRGKIVEFARQQSSKTVAEIEKQTQETVRKYEERQKEIGSRIAELRSAMEAHKKTLEEMISQIQEFESGLAAKQSNAMAKLFNLLSIRNLQRNLTAKQQTRKQIEKEFLKMSEMVSALEQHRNDRSELDVLEKMLHEFYADQEQKLAAFERNKEIRDVVNVMEREQAMIVHGFAANYVHAISVMDANVSWRERYNALVAFSPEIVCSSVRDESPERDTIYYAMGVILGNGSISGASKHDAASQVKKGERTQRTPNSEIEGMIHDAIQNPESGAWNEIAVEDPKIAGVYISEAVLEYAGDSESPFSHQQWGITYGKSPKNVFKNIEDFFNEAKASGTPVYIRGRDGKFYESKEELLQRETRLQDGIQYYEVTLHKGREIRSKDIINSDYEMSENKRMLARDRIFENSPFKLDLDEYREFETWKKAQKVYEESRKKDAFPYPGKSYHTGFIAIEKTTDLQNEIARLMQEHDAFKKTQEERIQRGRMFSVNEEEIKKSDLQYERNWAFHLFGLAEAAEKDEDSALAEKAHAAAVTLVSEKEYREMIARRAGPRREFRMTDEDLKHIST